MNTFGYIKVGTARPTIHVADTDFNSLEIIKLIDECIINKVKVVVFPELSITGYTCGELFFQQTLHLSCLAALNKILKHTKHHDLIIFLGMPLLCGHELYNVMVCIQKGEVLGVIPKTYLPNYNEFYEQRWFTGYHKGSPSSVHLNGSEVPFGTNLLFISNTDNRLIIAGEICEDLWVPIPPSSHHALNGATLIVNSSASNGLVGKHTYRKQLITQHSATIMAGYLYASAGYGESTTDVVYDGYCGIYENGSCINENSRFEKESQLITGHIDMELINNYRTKHTTYITHNDAYRKVFFTHKTDDEYVRKTTSTPFVPTNLHERTTNCQEIFNIQSAGLMKRLDHIGCKNVLIGLSGGLDSTLALLVCIQAFNRLGLPKEGIIAVTMPGFGTTDRTYDNAIALAKGYGVTLLTIPIGPACTQHFKDIDHDPSIHNITYENTQARERTQILMDLSNKYNGIVIGTGDLSELALGWATYNGDHMSMYGVNVSIPKTLVRYLIQWVEETIAPELVIPILKDIQDTPVSPELLPPNEDGQIVQKTEETVGPYLLHDFFLYHMLKNGFTPTKIYHLALVSFQDVFTSDLIKHWIKVFYIRFFTQQFKRSALPDGPKVGSIALSPRGDWRMPSDASYSIWIDEINKL